MVKVTVKPNGLVAGQTAWDGKPGSQVVSYRTMPLVEAASTEYASPAFFVPYRLVDASGADVDRCPWLDSDALGRLADYGLRLVFDVAVADVDNPDAHRNKKNKVPQQWRDEMWAKAKFIAPGCLLYDTPRGMRVVVALPHTMEIEEYARWCKDFRQCLRDGGMERVDEISNPLQFYWLPYSIVDGKKRALAAELVEPAVFVAPPPLPPRGGLFAGIERAEVFMPYVPPERVGQGERHKELTRYAGHIANKHKGDEETILALLVLFDRRRCDPPVQDENMGELEGIARWAARLGADEDDGGGDGGGGGDGDGEGVDPEGQEERLERGDHVELADRVARVLEKDTERLVFDLGKLWLYGNAGVWVELAKSRVEQVIHSFAGLQVRVARPQGGWALHPLKINASTVAGTYEVLCQSRAQKDFFANAPAGLTLADRWVEVTDNKLNFHHHNPAQRSRVGYEFGWSDKKPVRFLKLLDDVWEGEAGRGDKVQAFIEFIGAALCGVATRMQKAVILKGSGSNGKSTVITVVTGLFPEGTVTNVTPQNFGQQYYRAMLSGALLNVVGELPEKRLDQNAAAAIKALVSGDQIDGRVIRESPFFFRPKAGHLASCNALPEVEDDSFGFFRRFMLFDFARKFEATAEGNALAQTILAEERDAIVCWALRHAATLLQRGRYHEPQQSVDEVNSWRLGQDEISQFITDVCNHCEPVRGKGSDGASLYASYAVWAQANGYVVRNRQKFLQAVDRRCKRFYDNGVRNYRYPLELKA